MLILKYKLNKTNMAEEKYNPTYQDLDSETLDAFRYVLHNVKGISPVSMVTELATYDEPTE
jgi:hypothetical protein